MHEMLEHIAQVSRPVMVILYNFLTHIKMWLHDSTDMRPLLKD